MPEGNKTKIPRTDYLHHYISRVDKNLEQALEHTPIMRDLVEKAIDSIERKITHLRDDPQQEIIVMHAEHTIRRYQHHLDQEDEKDEITIQAYHSGNNDVIDNINEYMRVTKRILNELDVLEGIAQEHHRMGSDYTNRRNKAITKFFTNTTSHLNSILADEEHKTSREYQEIERLQDHIYEKIIDFATKYRTKDHS